MTIIPFASNEDHDERAFQAFLDRYRDMVERGLRRQDERLVQFTKSPIEASLGMALAHEATMCFDAARVVQPTEQACLPPTRVIAILPQRRIVLDGGTFYVPDFVLLLGSALFRPDEAPEAFVLVVECDGHDFHDRTKEQAERDRRRDRALLARGLVTARWTGSEIRRNAHEAAEEALALACSVGAQPAAQVLRLLNSCIPDDGVFPL